MAAPWKERLDSIRLTSLKDLFGVDKPVIGMVHLWPLPGAPGYTGYGMDVIVEQALSDARVLVEGGVDGLIVENMWDLPFYVGKDVPPEELTAMAVAARAVIEAVQAEGIPVGINVIHNGGRGCLAISQTPPLIRL